MFTSFIFKFTLIFFFINFFLIDIVKASSEVGIFYKENHHPIAGGEKEIRIMNFVGKQSKYKLESNKFAQKAYSIATCDLKKSKQNDKLYHSSPCSTSVLRNLQKFTVYCTADKSNKSYATVYFYPINKNVEGYNDKGWTASVFTFGMMNAGFSNDTPGMPLRKNQDPNVPLFTTGSDPTVTFNCGGTNRQ